MVLNRDRGEPIGQVPQTPAYGPLHPARSAFPFAWRMSDRVDPGTVIPGDLTSRFTSHGMAGSPAFETSRARLGSDHHANLGTGQAQYQFSSLGVICRSLGAGSQHDDAGLSSVCKSPHARASSLRYTPPPRLHCIEPPRFLPCPDFLRHFLFPFRPSGLHFLLSLLLFTTSYFII